MKQTAGASAEGCKSPPLPPDAKPSPDTPVTFTCRGESMPAFAEFLHQLVQQRNNLVQPVVDTTSLKDLWDFEIQLPTTQPRTASRPARS
jgi:uncharacterized protein (TIGR03435 family)